MSPPPSAQDRIPTFLRPSPLRIRLSPLAAANQDHWRHRILPLIISAKAFVPRSKSVSPLRLFNFILTSAISSDKITLARGRGSQLEDEDGNGIIPLNDCLNVRPRGAACLSPLGRSVLVTLPPAARPGAVLPFRLLSFVLSENEERSRRSRFPPIVVMDEPTKSALQLASSCAALSVITPRLRLF